VLSGEAMSRLAASAIDRLIITDTIAPRPEVVADDRVLVVSVAGLIAEAIRRTHEEESISSLFE
jgi:ribose-phosphate pyrophosphokinase